jgi:hypothetical protein
LSWAIGQFVLGYQSFCLGLSVILSWAISQFVLGCQSICLGLSVNLSWAVSQFSYIGCTFNKALLLGFFGCKLWIVFTPHIYFKILISMIAGNLVEIIRLPQIQNRKCLRKSNIWRYRAENVFGSLISARLDRRDYKPTTCLNPRNFFLPRCLKCSLPFKPIVSLIFC